MARSGSTSQAVRRRSSTTAAATAAAPAASSAARVAASRGIDDVVMTVGPAESDVFRLA